MVVPGKACGHWNSGNGGGASLFSVRLFSLMKVPASPSLLPFLFVF